MKLQTCLNGSLHYVVSTSRTGRLKQRAQRSTLELRDPDPAGPAPSAADPGEELLENVEPGHPANGVEPDLLESGVEPPPQGATAAGVTEKAEDEDDSRVCVPPFIDTP